MNKNIQVLTDNFSFEQAFKMCCEKYNHLQMYVAWVGNPVNEIPFNYLKKMNSISATVGISFDQSHPEGIKYLMGIDKKLRIIKNQNPLFHPKVYIFSKGKKKALLIGSSNFTYNGFFKNVETNILIDGQEYYSLINEKELIFRKWNLEDISFLADDTWLKSYRNLYNNRQRKLRKANIKDESIKDNHALASSWLNRSNWNDYVRKIKSKVELRYNVKDSTEIINQEAEELMKYRLELKLPWKLSYFNDIEKRKMMGGIKPYAWLGHVSASGSVRQLLANGTKTQKRIIITSINKIGEFDKPIDWQKLKKELIALENIGPTIKVWSRFLTITRPNLFCTFSSTTLRSNLAETLEVTQLYLQSIDGYIEFLKMIHNSPWFNSSKPKRKQEIGLWENRVAFLDEVFY